MSLPKIYLAGPITGCDYETATDWRDWFVNELADVAACFSPLRGKGYLSQEREISKSYGEHVMSTAKGITVRDRWDVRTAQLMIANFLNTDRVSVGTCVEFGWADAFGVPVITIIEKDGDNDHNHPILDEITGWRVHTFEEAAHIAQVMLDPR